MKKFLSAVALTAAMTFTTGTALANQYFYQGGEGQWSVEGIKTDDGVIFCVAGTYWDDGSYVSIITEKESDEIYLEVLNTDWNITDPLGYNSKEYVSTLRFVDRYGRTKEGPIEYELVSNQSTRMHYLTKEFFDDWMNYRDLYIVMPGSIQSLHLGLKGTSTVIQHFDNCIGAM